MNPSYKKRCILRVNLTLLFLLKIITFLFTRFINWHVIMFTSGHMSKLWAIAIVVVALAAAAFLCFILYHRQLIKQRKGMVLCF